MSARAERADRLAGLVAESELDLLIVSNLVNVRYLTGFSGTNGVVVIGPGADGARVFGTDFRYFERVQSELSGYELRRAQSDILEVPAKLVDEHAAEGRKLRLGFDDAHLTVRAFERLRKLVAEKAEPVAAGGLVERLRIVKDPAEVDLMRRAAAIAADLYDWLASGFGLAGHTEREVALALELKAKELGADGLSFPPIIAAGPNGALPHAEPGGDVIPRDTLVIVDLGCVVGGYCSDCTRTFATGDLTEEERSVYALVQQAQAAALEGVVSGADVREVDAIARRIIDEAGHGEQFGHGLGHGVGLDVHEDPHVGLTSEDVLEEGMVFTIEPGIYLPGWGGVRIEDIVVLENGRARVLSHARKLTPAGV
jgi:Xaa-Pro aminopeptidase